MDCDIQSAADNQQVETEQAQNAEQAQFFAHDCKNKIGVSFGEELELRLAAIGPSLAEQSTGADRNLRLDDVVSGAEWIGVGIQ